MTTTIQPELAQSKHLKKLTCLLGQHYVSSELTKISKKRHEKQSKRLWFKDVSNSFQREATLPRKLLSKALERGLKSNSVRVSSTGADSGWWVNEIA